MRSSITSSPAAVASKINNGGVEFLKRASYGEAISSFTTALSKVKQMLIADDEEDEIATTTSNEQQQQPQQQQSQCVGDSTDMSGDTFPPSMSSLESREMLMMVDPNQRSIFCKPIILRAAKDERPTLKLYNRYSIAIMFNLALAHHLSGMETSEVSRIGKLRKALRLYEYAYSIQMQEDVQLQITYTLGMVNNLGHIQEHLGEVQKAQQCFQHLLSTLMYVIESGEEGSDEGQWDVFFHNITHLVLRESALAAAA